MCTQANGGVFCPLWGPVRVYSKGSETSYEAELPLRCGWLWRGSSVRVGEECLLGTRRCPWGLPALSVHIVFFLVYSSLHADCELLDGCLLYTSDAADEERLV